MEHSMAIHDEVLIGTYAKHADVESAVRDLMQAGIKTEQLTVMGRSHEIGDAVMGHWKLPIEETAVMNTEGERAGFLNGGIWGLLGGLSIFLVPGLGEIALLGPLAGLLFGGGLGVFVGWLAGESTSQELSSRYRQRIASGEFLLLVTGPQDQLESVVDLMAGKAVEVERLPKHLRVGHHQANVL
jgi:hypothetical protein